MRDMAHSFLLFDFGSNEETAQQARHRIEGWRQGFRLDKKLQLKFERTEQEEKSAQAEENAAPARKASKASAKSKARSGAKSKPAGDEKSGADGDAESSSSSKIRLIVRLDFSDHEKLSHQRWIERIPTEEPFKNASPKIVRTGDPEFRATSSLFDSLD